MILQCKSSETLTSECFFEKKIIKSIIAITAYPVVDMFLFLHRSF